MPIVGFMMRNHLGLDFAGTNTAREGFELPPMAAGDVYTVDFHLQLPELYPSSFSFSPAIADGTLRALHNLRLDRQRDRAADEPSRRRSLRAHSSALPRGTESLASRKSAPAAALRGAAALVEFTGERVIPGQVNDDLWSEHVARYAFARRYARRQARARCGLRYRLRIGRTGALRRVQSRASISPPDAVEYRPR